MNDTTRDELRETIAGIIGNYGYQCINTESGYHESPDEEPIATEIIALVTAARDAEIRDAEIRDAEIREALLSDEAVESYVAPVKDAIKFWLDAIGLHGDGTGGQG